MRISIILRATYAVALLCLVSTNDATAEFRIIRDDHDKCSDGELPYYFDESLPETPTTSGISSFVTEKCVQNLLNKTKKSSLKFCKLENYRKAKIVELELRGQSHNSGEGERGCSIGGLGCCSINRKVSLDGF